MTIFVIAVDIANGYDVGDECDASNTCGSGANCDNGYCIGKLLMVGR